MKTITIDDKLYAFIASQTKHIGESASDILRRILLEDHGLVEAEADHVDLSKPEVITKEVEDLNKIKKNRLKEADNHEVLNASAVFSLLSEQRLKEPMSKVDRFLLILSALHTAHTDSFSKVMEIKGKGRLYFAKDKETLLQSGSSTNPKPIPKSSYWVVTNNNTAKKSSMIELAAEKLGYSSKSIQRLTELFDPSK